MNSFLKTSTAIIFIFLVSLSTSYNKEVIIDSKISDFVTHLNEDNHNFIHSTTTRGSEYDLNAFNSESKKIADLYRTDFSTFSSYISIEKNDNSIFHLSNPTFDLNLFSKILYFTFRFDINRTFMESIRLRQYRTDVESRKISDGYDFSFFISSIMADKIINASNGSIKTYDALLDYNATGLDFFVDVEGILKRGHISNIYYIEDINKISKSLYYYNDDFIILFGLLDKIFPGHQKVLNFDFKSTNISIENNLHLLNSLQFGDLHIFDNDSGEVNSELHQISYFMNNPYVVPIEGMILINLTIILSAFLIFFTIKKGILLKKSYWADVSITFLALILFHTILKVLSFFTFTSFVSFMLSNYIFGLITVIIIAISFLYYYLYYDKYNNDRGSTKKYE